MKRIFVLSFVFLVCFLVFTGNAESQLVRPLYVGSVNYNNQNVPMSLSLGYRLYFMKDSITFSRNNRPDVIFSDNLGANTSRNVNELFVIGYVGNLAARYYYEHTKLYSGSGSLSSDQYLLTTAATGSPAASLATSLDGRISSNRLEIGYPVYFSRINTTLEPFFVGEWINRNFTITSLNNGAVKDAADYINSFSNNLNSADSTLYGIGILYTQFISTNSGLTLKYLKTASSRSNNSIFDVEYRYYVNVLRNTPSQEVFFGMGYTYRTHSYNLNVGDLRDSSSGPYLGLAVSF